MHTEHRVLDYGYLQLVESWGSDQRIIEAARMSTNKGFEGWDNYRCADCGADRNDAPREKHIYMDGTPPAFTVGRACAALKDAGGKQCGAYTLVNKGDAKLLRYLWTNQHATPFEMAGAVIEVKAPLFVFREWHRHRTQSYNEMSARYIPLPDENYLPTVERIVTGAAAAGGNKQAQGTGELDEQRVQGWLDHLEHVYREGQRNYEDGLRIGIPKELARLAVPVARYSRMRASANLRNWLAFLTLRHSPKAQREIREYAMAMHEVLAGLFPRTVALWEEGAGVEPVQA